jgi:FMN phosphatase YigB (HAD superfamily)
VKKEISLFVTDLDNTLWDWFEMWHSQFSVLLDGLVSTTGIDRQVLETQIRTLHQLHGTSEYSFLIRDLPILRDEYPGVNLEERFADVIRDARLARVNSLKLYPGVEQTLKSIQQAGTTVIAYTESLQFWTEYRLRRLKVDQYIDYLYSPPDHRFPAGLSREDIRTLEEHAYRLEGTQECLTPMSHLKPDPVVLESIIAKHGDDASRTVYVGDSLMKDVAMAQQVGAVDVLAKYGDTTGDPRYSLLQRVSHWTQEDVDREHRLRSAVDKEIVATYSLERSLSELMNYFEFVAS